MRRRKQKFNREKSRTMWLAWCAWAVMGGIFVFEDTQGGTGWLTWTMTAPFWIAFALWPFLWFWLRSRRDETSVEIDDDIAAGEVKCRLVQKRGVRYAELDQVREEFSIQGRLNPVTLSGGNEAFVKLDELRPYAKENRALAAWLDVVDSLAYPRTYY